MYISHNIKINPIFTLCDNSQWCRKETKSGYWNIAWKWNITLRIWQMWQRACRHNPPKQFTHVMPTIALDRYSYNRTRLIIPQKSLTISYKSIYKSLYLFVVYTCFQINSFSLTLNLHFNEFLKLTKWLFLNQR